VTNITNHSLRLAWQDNSNNEDGFSVWRKRSDSDTFIFVATVPANVTTYDDSGLAADTAYDYHIQAGNVAGFSDFAGVLVTTAPESPSHVSSVTVAGGGWSAAFLGYLASAGLGADGFALPRDGSTAPPLPWSGLNQVRVHFDKDVPVTQADLVVSGAGGSSYPVTAFDYNAATHVATWTLGRAMVNDRVSIRLGADFSQGASDLQSDVDRSGAVNAFDLADVRRRLNRSTAAPGTGPGAYSPFADVNADGRIDAADLARVLRDQQNALAAPTVQSTGAATSARRDRPVTRTFFG
jgi:hypothetical protein